MVANTFFFKCPEGLFSLETSEVRLSQKLEKEIEHFDKAVLNCTGGKLQDAYNGQPCFFENQLIQVEFEPENDESYEFLVNGLKVLSSNPRKRQRITGSVRLQNAVGFTDFSVRKASNYREVVKVTVEVFPMKLSYKEDFQVMLSEISSILAELVFDQYTRTYLPSGFKDQRNIALNYWMLILKRIFKELVSSLDYILKNPHHQIYKNNISKDPAKVRQLDRKAARWVIKNSRYWQNTQQEDVLGFPKGMSISKLPECQKRITYDTIENRFVVWALRKTIQQIKEVINYLSQQYVLKGKASEEVRQRATEDIDELKRYQRILSGRLNDQYLSAVGTFNHKHFFSTVLTMGTGYKDFYHRFLLLQKGLALAENDIFRLDLKDIATLYEYWCFIKIIKTLKDNKKYNLSSTDFIKLAHQKFVISLRHGKESKVSFIKNDTGEEIKLFYNRSFSNRASKRKEDNAYSYTYTQRPDYFIQFQKEGYSKPFWYLLDAKYRFDAQADNDYSPPKDAIGQLHRYRDAILSKIGKEQFSYKYALKSLGGIILFPYPEDEIKFKNNPFYKSIDSVNIGALPLHPGNENALFSAFLDHLFDKSAEQNIEGVMDYDRREYTTKMDKSQQGLMIIDIPKGNQTERLDFHWEKKKVHLRVKEVINNPEKFRPLQVQYIALTKYDESKKARVIWLFGKVKEKTYATKSEMVRLIDSAWELKSPNYLIYTVSEWQNPENLCSYKEVNPMGRRYTSLYSFELYLTYKDKNYLSLIDKYAVRYWQELKEIEKKNLIRNLTANHREGEAIRYKFYIDSKAFTLIYTPDSEQKSLKLDDHLTGDYHKLPVELSSLL